MAKYKVEAYVEGLQVYLSWSDEREYWLVRNSLENSTVWNRSAGRIPAISNGMI